MSVTTLVVPPAGLAAEAAEYRIEGDAHHHLFRVKRLAPGDRLRLVDGAGRARFAEVVEIGKRHATARLAGEAPANEPARRVELYVAPPKPERAAWLVEKATEIGVAAISFLATERDARAFGPAQLDRLRRIAVAAVEQCGRAHVPEVAIAKSLDELLKKSSDADRETVALDAAGQSPLDGLFLSSKKRLSILVGPEGGWTEAERELFGRPAIEIWSLGERVLRVETAAVVAAGLALAAGTRLASG